MYIFGNKPLLMPKDFQRFDKQCSCHLRINVLGYMEAVI
jgi:hypothetical protein